MEIALAKLSLKRPACRAKNGAGGPPKPDGYGWALPGADDKRNGKAKGKSEAHFSLSLCSFCRDTESHL